MKTEQEYPAVVEQFRQQARHTVENASDGAEIVNSLTHLFAGNVAAHQAQVRGLATDARNAASEAQSRSHLLASTSRSVGRQVEVTARQAAQLGRYQVMERAVGDLVEQMRAEHPEISRRLGEILAEGEPSAVPVASVVIAFAPDTRWRLGWFARPGVETGETAALPFVGWSLVAASMGSVGQQPEACFLVGGRPTTLTELERREWVLQSCE